MQFFSKPKYRLLFIYFSLCLSVSTAYAQIAVTPSSTALALATALTGPGVTISSPTLVCNNLSNGTFTVTPGTVVGTGPATWGIGTGIILATGRAASAVGTAASLANTNMGTSGDADLTALAGASTFDACILEFDIIPTGDTIKFDYIFGSEEYNNSTCGPYNDAFAFFISGPGITGAQNMALIPGTTIPVTVNSVNSGVPGAGYTLANCTAMGPGSPFTTYYKDNTGGTSFTMKGFTKVLSAVHDVVPCNSYHLKLTIADAGNSGYDSEVFIKQGSISSHTNTSTVALCAGSTTSVTGSPSGGTWSSSNTAVATVDAVSGFVAGISGGTADLTYTTGAGCFTITTANVNPLPSFSGISSVCIGQSITLSATPTGGTWTGGGSGIATVTSAGVATGIAPGTVAVTYTDLNGCVNSSTVTVFNLGAITGPSTVCQGSTVALANATPGGAWTSSATTIATVTSATGVVSGVSAGSSNITYSLGGGCMASTSISVTALPTPPSTAPISYCPNAVASALTAGGTNLLWYTSATGGTGSATAPTPATNNPGLTTYYVSQTSGGCESNRTPLVVTINPPIILGVMGNFKVCKGDTVTFNTSATVPATGVYTWTISGGLAVVPPSTLSSTSLTVAVNGSANQTISLHVMDAFTGCSSDTTISITVTTPPVAAVFTQENVCLGDTVGLGLTSHSEDAYTYTWTIDGVPMGASPALIIVAHNSNSGGPYSVSWVDSGTHIITVNTTAQAGGCPSDPASDTVKVHPVPDANFSITRYQPVPCLLDSLYFAARTADYANTYMWSPEHSFYSMTGPGVWGIVETKVLVATLTVSNPFGCKASTSQTISSDACCRVSFPTAFTPNGDGNNDLFRPLFTNQGRAVSGGTDSLASYHPFHSFRIANRWGQTVFESTSNYPEWDGKMNGEPQDMGVFYYFVRFDCDGKTVTQSGDLTLIR